MSMKIEVICAQKLTRSSFKATFFNEKVSFFAFFRGIHPVLNGLHLFFLKSCDLQAMTRGFWPISRARCTGSGNRNSLRKKLNAKKLTLRAQKYRFWAVFPNFEHHMVMKIFESGKFELAWPRRLIWHPISLCRALNSPNPLSYKEAQPSVHWRFHWDAQASLNLEPKIQSNMDGYFGLVRGVFASPKIGFVLWKREK